jgi:NAD(P)-dependent dehydrogenase (short-subunit alcohol dehydrogenase family)
MARLNGKVVLITGASRGIGLAIAHALVDHGCRLVLTARHEKSLKRVSRELIDHGVGVVTSPCDVRDPDSVAQVFSAVRKQFGRLDILVNNAGVGHENTNVGKLAIKTWKDVVDTNLTGMFLVTRGALPLMKSGGAIVNNLSIAARRVFPGSSAYNASKHGALGLTNTLREELRPRGIRVIALLPGATATDIWKAMWPDAPRQKMMSPETVAQAVVDALLLPPESTVEELVIMPSVGTL